MGESNHMHFERPEAYVVPVIFALTFLIGLIGNAVIIITFLRNKIFKNVLNTYIFSLALADLLVIIAIIPFKSVIYTLESWPWGNTTCKITEATMNISISVSAFTLTALAITSYFSIAAKSQNTLETKPVTILTVAIIIAIWILATLLAIPSYISSHVRILKINSYRQIEYCYPYPEESGQGYLQTIALVKLLMHYIVPLFIIAIFYILMGCSLVLKNKNASIEMQSRQIALQVKTKIASTILHIVLVFTLCFLPTQVFTMWFYYSPTAIEDYNEWWHVLRIAGFCLSVFKSCINPIVLYCMDAIFRSYFKRYLLCRNSSTYDLEEPMSLSNRRPEQPK